MAPHFSRRKIQSLYNGLHGLCLLLRNVMSSALPSHPPLQLHGLPCCSMSPPGMFSFGTDYSLCQEYLAQVSPGLSPALPSRRNSDIIVSVRQAPTTLPRIAT